MSVTYTLFRKRNAGFPRPRFALRGGGTCFSIFFLRSKVLYSLEEAISASQRYLAIDYLVWVQWGTPLPPIAPDK